MGDRHPATLGMLRWFEYAHLPEDLRTVSGLFYDLAHDVTALVPDGPELTTCLRKLLEAKDCAVRARIEARP
jgi:ferritin-like protein